MISKTKLKLIKSLKYKKTRDDLNLFLVEGLKGILEVNNSKYKIIFTVVSNEIFKKHKNDLPKSNLYVVDAEEINKYSLLKKNNIGFCVVELIPHKFSLEKLENITIALDSISDPGNLGTIIRNADWYGIKNIICDISKPSEIDRLFTIANDIDFCINSAGTNLCKSIEHISLAEWDRVMNINLRSFYCICKSSVEIMKKNSGNINKWAVGLHHKLSYALTSLVLTISAIVLSVALKNSNVSYGIGLSLLIITIYYVMLIIGKNFGIEGIKGSL